MKTVRRMGELSARLLALEERVAAHDVELAAQRPPGVEFVTEAVLQVEVSVEHNLDVAFEVETRMEVWV